eukprot:1152601-Pelagomonas_calceolata.AAC.1
MLRVFADRASLTGPSISCNLQSLTHLPHGRLTGLVSCMLPKDWGSAQLASTITGCADQSHVHRVSCAQVGRAYSSQAQQ